MAWARPICEISGAGLSGKNFRNGYGFDGFGDEVGGGGGGGGGGHNYSAAWNKIFSNFEIGEGGIKDGLFFQGQEVSSLKNKGDKFSFTWWEDDLSRNIVGNNSNGNVTGHVSSIAIPGIGNSTNNQIENNNNDPSVITGAILGVSGLSIDGTHAIYQGARGLSNVLSDSKMLPKELTYLKVASKWVSWAGLGVSAYDIASNGLNFSNGLDAAMGGVSFVPYVGWIIGGVII